MIAQVLLEGLILGILLMEVCAFGIRKGAVGMVQSMMKLAMENNLLAHMALVLVFFRNCQKLDHYILPLLLSHNCFKIVPAFCDILHEPDVPFEDQFPVILFLINS